MSTKMYEAYRFPRGKLDEFILRFNKVCLNAVKDYVMAVDLNQVGLAATRRQLFGKNRKVAETYTDAEMSLIWTLARAILMSKTGQNNPFHLDCSFNLWLRGRYAYVQPFVTNCLSLPSGLPRWCKFYGYWDNADPQEGVSGASWEARKRIWTELALDDWHWTRLTHVVLEMKMPYLVGFETLLKDIHPDEEWRTKIYTAATCLFYKMEEELDAKRAKMRSLKAD